MYRFAVSFLDPFTLTVVLTALALANLWRHRRESRTRLLLAAVPFTALAALSTPAVAHLAASSLEYRYPPRRDRPKVSDTIVVLGGGVRPADGVRIETELGEDTLYRCLHAARLYHEGERCSMVLSGGKVDPRRPGPTCAEAMRDFLLSQGVAESDLVLESGSRSTYENALRTAELLAGRDIDRIILVTDALHMYRAEACFAAQGLEVAPSACHHRATRFRWSPLIFLPGPGGAEGVYEAAHEWLGLGWYWLHGRI